MCTNDGNQQVLDDVPELSSLRHTAMTIVSKPLRLLSCLLSMHKEFRHFKQITNKCE